MADKALGLNNDIFYGKTIQSSNTLKGIQMPKQQKVFSQDPDEWAQPANQSTCLQHGALLHFVMVTAAVVGVGGGSIAPVVRETIYLRGRNIWCCLLTAGVNARVVSVDASMYVREYCGEFSVMAPLKKRHCTGRFSFSM